MQILQFLKSVKFN